MSISIYSSILKPILQEVNTKFAKLNAGLNIEVCVSLFVVYIVFLTTLLMEKVNVMKENECKYYTFKSGSFTTYENFSIDVY